MSGGPCLTASIPWRKSDHVSYSIQLLYLLKFSCQLSVNTGVVALPALSSLLAPTMAAITAQPADPKRLDSSSYESESRSSWESAANEKKGDEEALISSDRPSRAHGQSPPSASPLKLLLWMLANTLATIGIVRPGTRDHQDPRAIADQSQGLHQQNPLHRYLVQTRPAKLCILPLLHDRRTPLHPLTTDLRILRAQTSQDPRNAAIGRRHVFERGTAKLLPRLLFHPLLPNLPRVAHAHRRCHQFLPVSEATASDGRPGACSHLRGCGNGDVL